MRSRDLLKLEAERASLQFEPTRRRYVRDVRAEVEQEFRDVGARVWREEFRDA